MKLSAKMPSQMDAKLPAKMPDSMPSDSQTTGDGRSDDAPVVEISRDTKRDSRLTWESIDDQKGDWQATDAKSGTGKLWEASDDIEGPEGGLPQRDPDNDGDLN